MAQIAKKFKNHQVPQRLTRCTKTLPQQPQTKFLAHAASQRRTDFSSCQRVQQSYNPTSSWTYSITNSFTTSLQNDPSPEPHPKLMKSRSEPLKSLKRKIPCCHSMEDVTDSVPDPVSKWQSSSASNNLHPAIGVGSVDKRRVLQQILRCLGLVELGSCWDGALG